VVTELNNCFTDYEAFYSFTTKSIESLGRQRNLLSLLKETYKMSHKESEAQLKTKGIVRDLLYRRTSGAKRTNPSSATKISSPLTRLAFSLLEKLNLVDEASLRNLVTSLHDLSFSLHLNAKKLREFIVVEKLKYRVLQMASSMTLGLVMKTFFAFAKFSFVNPIPSALVFISFASLSITIFTVFTCIIQLRYPSFKDLAICFIILAVIIFLPPYGYV